MRKLSDYKDEQALDLLAEVFEPAVTIMSDNEFLTAFDKNRLQAVKIAIKNHKNEVMQILAAMEGVPVEEYHCSIFVLPIRLGEIIMQIMNNPDLMAFFTPQGEKKSKTSFGSAMANTEENDQ